MNAGAPYLTSIGGRPPRPSTLRRVESRNLELIRAYYGAWNRGDLVEIARYLAGGLRVHAGSQAFGRNALLAFRAKLTHDFTELSASEEVVVAQRDKVVMRWKSRQRTRDSDRSFELHGVTIYRIDAGTIAEIWDVTSAPTEASTQGRPKRATKRRQGVDLVREVMRTEFGEISYLKGPSTGPPMVWMHGVSRRALSFRPQLEAFAKSWQVFALDARGHGRSNRAPGRYSWLDHADDLLAFLCAQVDGPAVLVGHSLGAMQAIRAGAARPDRVVAAVLEDPPLYSGERTDQDLGVFSAMEAAASSGMTAEQILSVWPREPWMTEDFRRDQAESLTELDPENLRVTIDLSACKGFDVDGTLSRMGCPTLVMRAGGPGAALRPVDQARALARLAKGQARVFESCGHMIHAEQPEQYGEAVAEFLASL